MKLSYAICVCNEARDLYSLLSFIKKVKDPEDEINILVDSTHVTQKVRDVIKYHECPELLVNERPFDGQFAKHRNYHISRCNGDYIFTIDPDEMPSEILIKNLKKILTDTGADFVAVPRINISPGYTQDWLDKCEYKMNEVGWINWPDYQGRIIKNNKEIKWESELHERIIGFKSPLQLKPEPKVALWHIKSVDKDTNRWDPDHNYVLPTNDNLYDKLM